jgi:hypothetical protein
MREREEASRQRGDHHIEEQSEAQRCSKSKSLQGMDISLSIPFPPAERISLTLFFLVFLLYTV